MGCVERMNGWRNPRSPGETGASCLRNCHSGPALSCLLGALWNCFPPIFTTCGCDLEVIHCTYNKETLSSGTLGGPLQVAITSPQKGAASMIVPPHSCPEQSTPPSVGPVLLASVWVLNLGVGESTPQTPPRYQQREGMDIGV